MAAPETKPKLVRAMGRWTFTALVVNTIIASGIFSLPDDVARLVGPAAPWAYLLGAAGALVIVIVFAELASQCHGTGGPYLYAREAFGPLVGIQTGWFMWLARIASAAAIANVFATYLGEFWSALTTPPARALLLLILFGGIVTVNIRGVRQGAGLSTAFTIAKLAPLVLFIAVGLFLAPRLQPAPLPTSPGTGAWIDALVVLLFAYGGFEAACVPTAEAKNPRGDAPFGLIVGFGIVCVIYLSIHVVTMWSVSNLTQSDRPLADAARVFAGPVGAKAISIGAVLSTFGGLCASAITAPRLVYALSERGDFLRAFSVVHPRYRTPYVAIIFFGASALGLALWGNFIWNAVLSVAARLVSYSTSCGALIQLRRTHPEADAWRAPAGRWLALIGIAFCLLLVARLTAAQAVIIGSVALLATINWWLTRSPRNAITTPKTA